MPLDLGDFDEYRRQAAARRAAWVQAEDAENRAQIRQAFGRNLALDQEGRLPSEKETKAEALREQEAAEIELRRNHRIELWEDIAAARNAWEPQEREPEAVLRGEFDCLNERVAGNQAQIEEVTTRVGANEVRVAANEWRIRELAMEVTRWICAVMAARTMAACWRSRRRSRPRVDLPVAKLEGELAAGRTMADIKAAENRPSLAARLGTSERSLYRALKELEERHGQSAH